MSNLYIGVLSGTSIDAIDVAAICFQGDMPQFIAKYAFTIPQTFREACLEITTQSICSLPLIAKLDVSAGMLFAKAVNNLLANNPIEPKNVTAIGSHGQTLWHDPNGAIPFTLQIGDPNIIAEQTGITTIADFRRRDIAAGGQGAPLAPAFHANVFRSKQESRIIVNIGGITNITVLSTDYTKPVWGFDTGPGNCLMDSWVKKYFNQSYDHNGEMANYGQVNAALLKNLLADPYFQKPAPKSTGREYFSLKWLNTYLSKSEFIRLDPVDVLATLLHLTSTSLINAIKSMDISEDYQLYLCGGGTHNFTLRTVLSSALQRSVLTTDNLGIEPDWVEAATFAWLAKQTLQGRTSNLPSVTGARSAVPLGGIYPASPSKQPILNTSKV